MPGIGRLQTIVLDCPDPQALARFYSGLLGWPVTHDGGDWVDIADPAAGQLSFQQAPGHRPPRWPDPDHPQQFHLDLTVDDLDVAEKQTLALGAVKAETQPGQSFRVFLDPAGHPFCLCAA